MHSNRRGRRFVSTLLLLLWQQMIVKDIAHPYVRVVVVHDPCDPIVQFRYRVELDGFHRFDAVQFEHKFCTLQSTSINKQCE
jgi:hypothetical protein